MKQKIDKLMRFHIPSKVTKGLNIVVGDELELTIEYGNICIKRFESSNIKKRAYIGTVRKLNKVNRIQIPIEFLRILEIELEDTFEIVVEKGKIKLVRE